MGHIAKTGLNMTENVGKAMFDGAKTAVNEAINMTRTIL